MAQETITTPTDTDATVKSLQKQLEDTKSKMSSYSADSPKNGYADVNLPTEAVAAMGKADLTNLIAKAKSIATRGNLSQAVYNKLLTGMVATDADYRKNKSEALLKDHFDGKQEEYDKYKALANKDFDGGLSARELALYKKLKAKLSDDVVGGNDETGISAVSAEGGDALKFNKAKLTADGKTLDYIFDGKKYSVLKENFVSHFLETIRTLPIGPKRQEYSAFRNNEIRKVLEGV